MNTSTEKSRAAIVRLLQELGPEEKLIELEEVIDYLTSYVEDEDADTEGLRITLVGFFEYFEEKEELDRDEKEKVQTMQKHDVDNDNDDDSSSSCSGCSSSQRYR